MIRNSSIHLITVIALLSAASAALATTTIDFSSFPGSDNTLGTGDDVPITTSYGSAVFFTTEYSSPTVGAGFLVDSAIGGNPVFGYNSSLGAIVSRSGNNVLVVARPDAGSGQYSYAALRYRFVDPGSVTIPVAVTSVEFDFVSGISIGATNTAKFFDLSGALLSTETYIDGVGNNHISYNNPVGIARVDIDTTFSVATDNISYSGVVPEPSSGLMLAITTLTLTITRRARRRS